MDIVLCCCFCGSRIQSYWSIKEPGTVSIGGPCAVEGCKRIHMYNSSVCFKHKESKERYPKQQTETKHYPYPKRNWLEFLCVIYLLPAAILNFTGSHNIDLGAFGRIYMSGIFICFLILFILSRDEDYRRHSLFMKPKDKESEEEESSAKKNSEKLSPKERQALMSRKCSVPGCNTGNFRMTDYCHKHQDHKSSNSEPESEEEEAPIEPEAEENWWEDEN